ncbi:MAG: ATPase domain-containing protein [Candidatus Nezhaarchaeales archaeon]
MNSENSERSPSGILGLDEIIGGGFPRGSLIMLVGEPGTGKTTFSAQFLYRGAVDCGEKGIYVSFAEDKKSFLKNMLYLGFNFEELEKRGLFIFREYLTVRETGLPETIDSILRDVSTFEARRLVIDSFTALAQAFMEPHEVRVLLHSLLSKFIKFRGCTSIIIIEKPYGKKMLGLGIEEFVADCIFLLKISRYCGRGARELKILKTKGSPTFERHLFFTLKDGFRVLQPFKFKHVEKPCRFKPRPDTELCFSTGSRDLDEMLGGGYPRGSIVLVDVDPRVTAEYHLIVTPIIWNFIAQGRGVIITPSPGVDHNLVRRRIEGGGFTRDEINRLLRVCIKRYPEFELEQYIYLLEGEDPERDLSNCFMLERELAKLTGQPVLRLIGVDTLMDIYDPEKIPSIFRALATWTKSTSSLGIAILKPGTPRLRKFVSAIADLHLKVTRRHGTVLVYGIKPRTKLHALEMDVSEGCPMPRLTPII